MGTGRTEGLVCLPGDSDHLRRLHQSHGRHMTPSGASDWSPPLVLTIWNQGEASVCCMCFASPPKSTIDSQPGY